MARRRTTLLPVPLMNKLQGLLRRPCIHQPDAYFKTIKFWKTPLAQCNNRKRGCVRSSSGKRPGLR